MARKAQRYAEALVEALKAAPAKEHERIVARFKELVFKRGDRKLMGDIVKEFARQWEAREGTVALLVTSGSSFARNAIGRELQAQGYTVKEKRDERLIGGMAVFLGTDYLLDNSVRGRLRRLYARITK